MALNIDTDGLRRTSDLVESAGTVLELQLGDDVPACGQDEVSQALMGNLNAWQRWLVGHVRAGAGQAFSAAAGIDGTAAAYEAEDLAAAARYPGGGSSAAAPTFPPANIPAAAPAPTGAPTLSPIPDISGRDGEQLALALESGAGPGPAIAAAARLSGLASQAMAANTALTAAQTQLLASGESEASPPLLTKLTRAIAWTEAVAGHATALADGYTSAAGLHTSTKTAVGPSADWRMTKEAYRQAVSTPGAGALAQGYRVKLTGMQQSASSAMTGYQSAGETASTPPATLPDPGLDPNADGAPNPAADPASDEANKLKDPDAKTPGSDTGSGAQDMLSSLMGAFGPLMESLGKANPLSSLGQLGQQLGQQAGDLTKAATQAGAPIKPAALAKAHPAGGGHKGGAGGGAGIKPATSLAGAVHPASLTGTPAPSPPATPIKPASAAAGASPSGAGGAGMMPMGHGGAGDKAAKVKSYEQPLPEVEDKGRPGTVPETAKPEPVVNPEVKNAVKARLAARKKDASPTTES
ncbi:PPE domain-containing protein [Mycobacterium xenopi]|uniref:PPE domain-containing protein n=1 Tax=Mycobacterium xenopi TaxID=1789 RepID=UPI000A15BD1D|nr:PPE domain-containing protein [Mycobacterium xenopi]ORX14143.1 Fis family transcriptional regulator [Mycobacterium xenopi]SPX94853.1 Fis family transcriptional regulator [Mycobacterium xenopi]